MLGINVVIRRTAKVVPAICAIMLLYTITLIFGGVRVHAQNSRVTVANSYEQSGDYRSAARLWQSLYDEDPKNEEYFLGVCRTLKALNNIQGIRDIVEARLPKYRTANTLIMFGQLQWTAGKEQDATDAWAEVLQKGTPSERMFLEVARAQVDVRAFEQAIETLQRARKTLKRPELFADDLAKLYATVGDIPKGLREIIQTFDRSSQLSFAQGRISALLTTDSTSGIVYGILNEEYRSRRANDVAFMRLFEWLLRELRRPQEAYSIVCEIDEKTSARGREIVNFAETMRAEGNYAIAMQAFSRVIELGKRSDVAQYAAFGYAACSESQISDTGSNERIVEMIDLYRKIIRDYPRTSSSADAYIRVAALMERSGASIPDIEKEYDVLRQQYEGFPQAAAAVLSLARIRVLQDRMDDALQLVSQAAVVRGTTEDIIDEARFQRGEILFFQGFIDSALTEYAALAEKPESNFSNDAIERMTSIRLCSDDSLILSTFARAGKERVRRNPMESLRLYETIIGQKRNTDMAELACMKCAEVCFAEKRYEQTRSYCDRLRLLSAESIFADRSTVMIARSYKAEGKIPEARAAYEELLRSFPRSIFTQEARTVLRQRDMQP